MKKKVTYRMYYAQCQVAVFQEGIMAMPMDITLVNSMNSKAIIETIKHQCASEATKLSMQQGTGIVKPQEVMIVSIDYLGDRVEEVEDDRSKQG